MVAVRAGTTKRRGRRCARRRRPRPRRAGSSATSTRPRATRSSSTRAARSSTPSCRCSSSARARSPRSSRRRARGRRCVRQRRVGVDRFKVAEERIDQEAIESEIDAAMRGEAAEEAALEAKLARAGEAAGLLPAGAGGDDAPGQAQGEDDRREGGPAEGAAAASRPSRTRRRPAAEPAAVGSAGTEGSQVMLTTAVGPGAAGGAPDLDEALSTRLRDLALVELDALIAGDRSRADRRLRRRRRRRAPRGARPDRGPARAAGRGRSARRARRAGPPARLGCRRRGADRARARLATQAEAARALARLADLASALVPKLFRSRSPPLTQSFRGCCCPIPGPLIVPAIMADEDRRPRQGTPGGPRSCRSPGPAPSTTRVRRRAPYPR